MSNKKQSNKTGCCEAPTTSIGCCKKTGYLMRVFRVFHIDQSDLIALALIPFAWEGVNLLIKGLAHVLAFATVDLF